MLQLRPYQQDACDAILACLSDPERNWVHPYASMSVGFGKSLCAAHLALSLATGGKRVAITCPSQVLVQQNYDEALRYAPLMASAFGRYTADRKDRKSAITICTIQAWARSTKAFGAVDYIIIDECHGVNMEDAKSSYAKVVAAHSNARVIGMTGSPWRMQGGAPVALERLKTPLFGQCVYSSLTPSFHAEMLRSGYYCHLRPGKPLTLIDTTGMRIKAGEYDEGALSEAVIAQAQVHVQEALSQMAEHERKHAMWFCVNIAHAKVVADILKAQGEDVVRVTGDLAKHEALDNIAAFAAREHRHIVSVASLIVGFNARHVDCLVQLRPTRSLPLYVQSMGRAIRSYPGLDYALILDATDNTVRLGPLNAPGGIEKDDSIRGYWECGKAKLISAPTLTVEDDLVPEEQRTIFAPGKGRPHLRLANYSAGGSCGFLNEPWRSVCPNCLTARDFILRKTARSEGSAREGERVEDDLYARENAQLFSDGDGAGVRGRLSACVGSLIDFNPETGAFSIVFVTTQGPVTLPLNFFGATYAAVKARQYAQVAGCGRLKIDSGFRAYTLRERFDTPSSLELDDDGKVIRVIWTSRRQWLAPIAEVLDAKPNI